MKQQAVIRTILTAFITTFIFSGTVYAQERNPFPAMVGKPYSEYHDAYLHFTDSLFYNDSSSRTKLLNLLKEATVIDKSGEWEFNYKLMEYNIRFFDSRKGAYIPSNDYTAEDHVGNLLTLKIFAEEKGLKFCRIRSLFHIAETYRIFIHDYERAFAYYLEMASELDKVNIKEFPPRPYFYCKLGDLYYMFREYADAMFYYRKVIDDPDAWTNSYKEYYSAMNGLGLCYRNGYKDYEHSNDCFRQILEWAFEEGGDRQWVWEGVAEGNIGYNYYLQGDWNTALSWLVPALDKITNPGDFPFASQRAVNVADIYLKKRDLVSAKRYIDMALDRHYRSEIPDKNSYLYEILARYHTSMGNSREASAYLDSVLITKANESEAFSGLILRRIEQQLRTSDNKIHEQKLEEEKIRSSFFMRTAILLSTALIVILVLLGLVLFFYRRKRNAYRELVRRSQDWAGINLSEETEISDENTPVVATTTIPNERDSFILENIEKTIADEKLYKQADMTLDSLAEKTGFNRYYISAVLNRYTGKNFKTYINEYRIKEAVRIMSNHDNDGLTIDSIAFEAGFTDRKNFYRVFKKITGLSPSEFRQNITT